MIMILKVYSGDLGMQSSKFYLTFGNQSMMNIKEKLQKIETAKLKKILLYGGSVGVGILFLFFVVTSTLIGYSVREKCELSQSKYEGDCVEALISHLEDEENSYRERNNAIWALGQIGDERTLPILNKYYTGVIKDREPFDGDISQYELKKAINLAGGGFNMTAFVWRNGVVKVEN